MFNVLICSVVLGATVALQPVADTSLFENSPDNNLGTADLAAGTTSSGSKSRALIRFELAGKVPGDATITSVELMLRVSRNPPSSVASTFGLYRALQGWSEGRKGGRTGSPATAGETSWNVRSFPAALWSAPGASAPSDYAATASGTTSISGLGSYIFASAPQLIADIQSWLANPGANFGWILISQSESLPRTARRFASREDPNNGPLLIIQYSTPAQGTSPAITAHPQSQTVAAGGAVSFSATATGTAPLGYQWKLNGNDLAGATSSNLAFNNVQTVNAGNYSVVVSNSAGSVTSSAATLTVDSPPTVTINDVRVVEGNTGSTFAGFSVGLSATSGRPVAVDFSTASGTALAGSDYVEISERLVFPPGETNRIVFVRVVSDNLPEPDESYFVNLTNPVNATLARSQAVGTIVDDDPMPVVTINDVRTVEGNAGSTSAVFSVLMSSPVFHIVSLSFSTENGTAMAGSDYTTTNGTLVFSPGETAKSIIVSLLGDTIPEPDESYLVNLANPVNATIARNQAVGTIIDDDANTPPSISITKPSDGTVFSAGADILIQAVATDPDSGGTISKVEFFQGNTKLGEDSSILQQIVWTNVSAGVYSLTAKAADNRGATAISTPVIITVTSPAVTIDDVSVIEGSGGATNALFTVTLSSTSIRAVSVDFSTVNGTANAGSDYTPTASKLIFNPGESSKLVAIPVVGDTLYEGNETFFVRLSNPINATLARDQGQGTIIDDDPPPFISINDVSVSEGDKGTTSVAFSVSLSTAGGKTVSVEYATINETATVGSDYAPASGALTFNPGETNKTIFVLVVGDTAVERDEFFLMILSNPLNASIGREQGRGTILNDDSSVSITTQPKDLTISLGGSATVSVTAAGSGALSYQWKFNGADISGAASPTLSLDNVQPANAGSYTVVITNSGGAISSAPATLIVLVPPSITQQPQSQTVTLAANVTLSVSVTGSDPLRYQWKFNDIILTDATGASLALSNVQPTNAGSYTVVVSNTAGSATSAAATLTVLVGPTITQQPVSQTANAGASVVFNVAVTGSDPLRYQWKFNDIILTDATGASLALSNVQPTNAGSYTVVVSNTAGSVTSAAATLTVLVGPTITQQPQSQTINQGSDVVFTVIAAGSEPLNYQWKFGSIAESVGEKDASQQQAGESVTRSDRRRRELEARSSSPPLARLLLGSLAASGGTGDHTLAVANRLESPDITGSLCGLCKKSTHRLC